MFWLTFDHWKIVEKFQVNPEHLWIKCPDSLKYGLYICDDFPVNSYGRQITCKGNFIDDCVSCIVKVDNKICLHNGWYAWYNSNYNTQTKLHNFLMSQTNAQYIYCDFLKWLSALYKVATNPLDNIHKNYVQELLKLQIPDKYLKCGPDYNEKHSVPDILYTIKILSPDERKALWNNNYKVNDSNSGYTSWYGNLTWVKLLAREISKNNPGSYVVILRAFSDKLNVILRIPTVKELYCFDAMCTSFVNNHDECLVKGDYPGIFTRDNEIVDIYPGCIATNS